MAKMNRRNFLKAAASGTVLLAAPYLAKAASGRVVIVGGGTGGATAAKYLRRLDPTLEVTLIERSPNYITCYMSNEVLSGGNTLDKLTFGYDGLRAHGVNVVFDEVTAIDPSSKTVATLSGVNYPYDRCIVSPGIDFRFETINGYDATVAETVPHAWKAGSQTLLLKAQLEAMADGGTVVIASPPNPYRCPPAPYERASQIAFYLQRNKPRSKVMILDSKTSFAKKALFEEGWTKLYGYGTANSLIDWVSGPDSQVTALDATGKAVTTAFGDSVAADVINIIPAQKAGPIAFAADLTDASGWCPVNKRTFESTRHAGIHVIGDACIANGLPKSGFAANSEAKVCAAAVVALLSGNEPGNPSFANTCYSLLNDEYAISILAIYRLSQDGSAIESVSGSGGVSEINATPEMRLRELGYAHSWYKNFTKDVFG